MIEMPSDRMLRRATATARQLEAADPQASAWVRANAGTGKTYVLVQRILALLATGADPKSILCLTYTKNAAAEMEERVLRRLGEWATAPESKLLAELERLLRRAPSPEDVELARCLFASVIDSAGGLPIMTLHAFCERVLRRFSLEANVPPSFTILADDEGREALKSATEAALIAKNAAARRYLATIVAFANEDKFDDVLSAMLGQRAAIADVLRTCEDDADIAGWYAARLRPIFGLQTGDTQESLRAEAEALIERNWFEPLIAALSQAGTKDSQTRSRLMAALGATTQQARLSALRELFLTNEGDPRKTPLTTGVQRAVPSLYARFCEGQDRFVEIEGKLRALRVVEASAALLALTADIFERYEAEKRKRAALDFDDLIEKTLQLLSRSEAAQFVLYQLDGRIDHILVDEAQDTSPAQWRILEALTEDFFSGEGRRETVPTMFAVGDEKQSIYSFQGARPEELNDNGQRYSERVSAARFSWREINLDLSFRTLQPVLTAVDVVLSSLSGFGSSARVPHAADREGHGGFVEIWEPERAEGATAADVWSPELDEAATASSAPGKMATRIADQIAHWLEAGEVLETANRAIEPGDILILLRKRNPMLPLLQKALKARGIPVAGADRMALLDTLAAMDLLALADALLLPDDDLALAAALKSPLFGITEDELYDLAYGREGSLWDALFARASESASFARAAEQLGRWRDMALTATPFEFFATLLDGEHFRERFEARLGGECHEALNEFLAAAERYSRSPDADLSRFVAFLRRTASEVKRESEQAKGQVRIMTVHGAKGLEANIVVLADTCSKRGNPPSIYFLNGGTGPDLPVWAVTGAGDLAPITAAKALHKAEAEREEERLLYVAMTRARDRLYIGGFHAANNPPNGCWYEKIRGALEPHFVEAEDYAGRRVFRSASREAAYIDREAHPLASGKVAPTPPPWMLKPLADETAAQFVAPSRLFAMEGEAKAGAGVSREEAQQKGLLIHRLLEVLPQLPEAQRERAAQAIAQAFEAQLPRPMAKAAVDTVLTLLGDARFQEIFGEGLSEVPFAMRLTGVSSSPLITLGQADRLCLEAERVRVYDYKSGATVRNDAASQAYLGQLALYRHMAQIVFPGKFVDASLVDAGQFEVKHLAEAALDGIIAGLLEAGTSSLDA